MNRLNKFEAALDLEQLICEYCSILDQDYERAKAMRIKLLSSLAEFRILVGKAAFHAILPDVKFQEWLMNGSTSMMRGVYNMTCDFIAAAGINDETPSISSVVRMSRYKTIKQFVRECHLLRVSNPEDVCKKLVELQDNCYRPIPVGLLKKYFAVELELDKHRKAEKRTPFMVG